MTQQVESAEARQLELSTFIDPNVANSLLDGKIAAFSRAVGNTCFKCVNHCEPPKVNVDSSPALDGYPSFKGLKIGPIITVIPDVNAPSNCELLTNNRGEVTGAIGLVYDGANVPLVKTVVYQ